MIFRSFFAALASIIPNLFPIFAAGGVLYLSGYGLQFSSAVALTVAFGLAVNDSIHFLHRLHLERMKGAYVDSVTRTVQTIGPVLMLTTIVLICGLAVTAFSGLPSLRMFGWLSGVTLFAALIGDLVLLPAFYNLERRITGGGITNGKWSSAKAATTACPRAGFGWQLQAAAGTFQLEPKGRPPETFQYSKWFPKASLW